MIFLLLFLASLTYTAWRFWGILPLPPVWKTVFVVLHVLLTVLPIPFFAFEKKIPLQLSRFLYIVSTSWMVVFVYSLLIFLLLDIGRLVRLVPASFLKDSLAGTLTVAGSVCIILLGGRLHYNHKYRVELDVLTEKPLGKPLKVVMASDLHVGYHNRREELSRWVDLILDEKPDLVLFAGDVIDGSVRPVRAWHYDEEFRRIGVPVIACPGNHEYISGIDNAAEFFKDAGITLLRDSSVDVCGLRVVGRDDRSNRSRQPLDAFVGDVQPFTLLLDHQPYHLEDAERCGVDFQFSGHTHHGQIFPGNLITSLMYEKDFGSYSKGKTGYYISSGLGIWGGRFRIGTRSEYVVLNIHN